MKRRIWSMLLALALSLRWRAVLAARLGSRQRLFYRSQRQPLPLNDSTMPFWSGGNLYLPSSVFSSYDLGLSYVRDTSAQTAILYSSNKVLEFDLARGGANNKLGTYYSASGYCAPRLRLLPAFLCQQLFFFELFGTRHSSGPHGSGAQRHGRSL